jgi:putative PIN family toxin of toxin-antitoxin system
MNSRLVIDNSVIVASFISQQSYSLKKIIRWKEENKVVLCVSKELMNELKNSIQKKKVKEIIRNKSNKIGQFMAWYKYNSKIFIPKNRVSLCRDPEDNMVLSLAQEANAGHILTYDKDLLSLKTFKNATITKPFSFSPSSSPASVYKT